MTNEYKNLMLWIGHQVYNKNMSNEPVRDRRVIDNTSKNILGRLTHWNWMFLWTHVCLFVFIDFFAHWSTYCLRPFELLLLVTKPSFIFSQIYLLALKYNLFLSSSVLIVNVSSRASPMANVCKGRCPKKKRENVGIFPKWGTPPSPLFGNDTLVKKNMVFFCISGP